MLIFSRVREEALKTALVGVLDIEIEENRFNPASPVPGSEGKGYLSFSDVAFSSPGEYSPFGRTVIWLV